jgi:hypothetical protein
MPSLAEVYCWPLSPSNKYIYVSVFPHSLLVITPPPSPHPLSAHFVVHSPQIHTQYFLSSLATPYTYYSSSFFSPVHTVHIYLSPYPVHCILNGTLTREILPMVFFHQITSANSLIHTLHCKKSHFKK